MSTVRPARRVCVARRGQSVISHRQVHLTHDVYRRSSWIWLRDRQRKVELVGPRGRTWPAARRAVECFDSSSNTFQWLRK